MRAAARMRVALSGSGGEPRFRDLQSNAKEGARAEDPVERGSSDGADFRDKRKRPEPSTGAEGDGPDGPATEPSE